MQIVIEISDEEYEDVKKTSGCYYDFGKAIFYGTTLPKGHGRIGDLSKIYVELNEAQIEGTEEYKGLGKAKQMICDAPTIIEADKVESEKDDLENLDAMLKDLWNAVAESEE